MSGTIFLTMTMFLVLFSGILITYGIATPAIAQTLQGPINCDVNNSPSQTCAFPQWNAPSIGGIQTNSTTTKGQPSIPWWQCIIYLPACIASSTTTIVNTATSVGGAIWGGLQLIAYGIEWFAIATFVFFNKLAQAILMIFGITQIMSQTGGFIVFLPYFFLSFLIFYILYGISMLKPGGSGLPG